MKLNWRLFNLSTSLKDYKFNISRILFVSLFIISAMLLSVSATNYLEPQNFWSNWQNDEGGTGGKNSGLIQTYFINGTHIASYSSVSYGNSEQPLIGDLDSDGIGEIFITSGSQLFAYTISGGNLILKGQQLLDGNVEFQGAIINLSDNGFHRGGLRLVYVVGDNLSLYSFDGSTFNKTYTKNLTIINSTVSTDIKCSSSILSATRGDSCYWGTSTGYIAGYFSLDNTFQQSAYKKRTWTNISPTISTNFNGQKLAFASTGATKGSIFIIEPSAFATVTNWSVSTNYQINELSFFNADGGGYDELFAALGSTSASLVSMYDVTGATLSSDTLHNYGGGTSTASGLAFCKTSGFTKNTQQVAAWSYNSFASIGTYELAVFNISTLSFVNNYQFRSPNMTTNRRFDTNIIAADADGNSYCDIITPFQIIYPSIRKFINLTITNNINGFIALGDLDNDLINEIVSSDVTTGTWVATQYPAGGSTVSSITHYQNGRDLDRNFGNPGCLGTTIEFTGYDCRYFPNEVCNYNTSAPGGADTSEYLYSTCGNNSINPLLGPFYVSIPGLQSTALDCNFDSVGTKVFKVYLTDTISGINIATDKYWVETVQVNNGSSLFSCNINPYTGSFDQTGAIVPGTGTNVSDGTLSPGDLKILTDALTGGGSTFVKTLLVMAFSLALIVYLAKFNIANPMIYAAGITVLWICLALIGFLSWVIVLIFFIGIGITSAIIWAKQT